jgi:DNA-binding NtrC family response regulator
MRAEQQYRPLALVLSHRTDGREHDCRLLSEKGYNVIAFADAESTEAWLEEETPEVAIVDMPVDPRQHDILETLAGRGVMLIPPV